MSKKVKQPWKQIAEKNTFYSFMSMVEKNIDYLSSNINNQIAYNKISNNSYLSYLNKLKKKAKIQILSNLGILINGREVHNAESLLKENETFILDEFKKIDESFSKNNTNIINNENSSK